MTEAVNYGMTDVLHSPVVYGPVTEGVNFTDGGEEHVARVLLSDDDGTIDIVRVDGTTVADYPVFKGANIVQCIRVSDVNGRTLFWQA